MNLVLRNKVVVLGDLNSLMKGNATCGKTALIKSFQPETPFSHNYIMTAHSDLSVKVVNIPDTDVTVELYLSDLGGNEIFQEYVLKHLAGATSYMLVFDTTQTDSFHALPKWLSYLKQTNTLKQCRGGSSLLTSGILVATKLDQAHRRAVSQSEGEDFAKQNGLAYFETSSVDAENSEAPFYYLAHTYFERFEEQLKGAKRAVDS